MAVFSYVLAHTTKVALLGGALLALIVVVAARSRSSCCSAESSSPRPAPVLQIQGPVVLTIFVIYSWTAFLIADGHRRARSSAAW